MVGMHMIWVWMHMIWVCMVGMHMIWVRTAACAATSLQSHASSYVSRDKFHAGASKARGHAVGSIHVRLLLQRQILAFEAPNQQAWPSPTKDCWERSGPQPRSGQCKCLACPTAPTQASQLSHGPVRCLGPPGPRSLRNSCPHPFPLNPCHTHRTAAAAGYAEGSCARGKRTRAQRHQRPLSA